jgi:3'-5' exoribonuclease
VSTSSDPAAQPEGDLPGGPIARPAAARIDIASLRPGDRIEDQVYRLAQKDLRTAQNGDSYIHAVLADRSGQILARMWQASRELFESLEDSALVRVRGRVESYKNKPQFILDGIERVEAGGIDPRDLLPSTPHDVDQMWRRLCEILDGIRQPDLKALVGSFTDNAAFAQRFRMAPAARTYHHAYLGGLLEHTLDLLELALLVLPRYPRVSRDLVLAGIFFHDAGKAAELSYETNFDYTTEGQLVGHIVQAATWVHEAARSISRERGERFPDHLLAALKHIILAHHGQYEFGCPKLPATAEAFLVHYLDNLDAKLNMVFAAIDDDGDPGSDWTAYVPALQTKLFKRDVTGGGA